MTSSLWLLIGHVDSSTNDRCSSHAQSLLIFFPAYTHASSGEAYEEGEDRVQCPRMICELRWKLFGVGDVEESEAGRYKRFQSKIYDEYLLKGR